MQAECFQLLTILLWQWGTWDAQEAEKQVFSYTTVNNYLQKKVMKERGVRDEKYMEIWKNSTGSKLPEKESRNSLRGQVPVTNGSDPGIKLLPAIIDNWVGLDFKSLW